MNLTSDDAYWKLKNGLLRTYPTCHESQKCDVLVVGGGISGALMLDALVNAGMNAILIDKRDIAAGSTSASTAMLQYEIDQSLQELSESMPLLDAEKSYWACFEALKYIEKRVNSLGNDCAFTPKESLYLASKKSHVKDLKKEYQLRKAAGFDLDFLEESDISKQFGIKREAAILTKHAAIVDPYRLSHQLLENAAKMGARIFDRSCLTGIDVHPNGLTLSLNTGAKIKARHLVMATGYETQAFLKVKKVKLSSSFAIVTKPLESFSTWKNRCLIWETNRPYSYMRPTSDNRAMIGGLDEDFRNPSLRDALVPTKSKKLAKTFSTTFPEINFDVAYQWAGTFAESEDGLPYIGPIKNYPHCFFVCGYGGNGTIFSAVAAKIVQEAIQGREDPVARIFSFQR